MLCETLQILPATPRQPLPLLQLPPKTPATTMGNGAKAQQKQQRNAKKTADAGGKSQSKTNEAAKNIICMTCRQTFLSTTRMPALTQHVENKHVGKTVAECFPGQKD
ncbi:DUF1909-domain-containing protein [Ceratobasidium sp. AG-I]|nr:DUF1909-domain-containing protein [Ceratobasidium sp. AG-I]